MANVSGLPSTNKLQGIVPSCTVTVYLTGTTTLAPISVAPSNPFVASTTGQWLFYASTSSALDIVMSGGIPPNVYVTPVTITAITPGGGGGGGGGGGATSSITINQLTMTNAVQQLPSISGLINGVRICALATNVNPVFVGGSTVNTTIGSGGNGDIVMPQHCQNYPVTNANLIYVNSASTTDGITYAAN